MSRRERIVIDLFDDLDLVRGTETTATQQVTLRLNNRTVELDLTQAHAASLYKFLDPYLTAGRRVTERRERSVKGRALTEARAYNRGLRAWASQDPRWKDREWPPSGYIPFQLRLDYRAALEAGYGDGTGAA